MPYTTEQWLVDRTLIHDTITSFALYGDTRQWDKLAKYFPAPKMIRDYSQLFGSEPQELTPEGLVHARKPLLESMTSTQHLITSFLVNLPLPNPNIEPPTKTSVNAYIDVHLTKEGAEGGDHIATGGRYEFELVRLGQEELRGLVGEDGIMDNPWRVSVMRASSLTFMTGNKKILFPEG